MLYFINEPEQNGIIERRVHLMSDDETAIPIIERRLIETSNQNSGLTLNLLSEFYFKQQNYIKAFESKMTWSKLGNNDLNKWFLEIEKARRARHTPVVIVVSNKCDLNAFCEDNISEWVREHSFDHIYTSAKTGEGIDSLFNKIHDSISVHQSDWLTPSLPALPVHPCS